MSSEFCKLEIYQSYALMRLIDNIEYITFISLNHKKQITSCHYDSDSAVICKNTP